MARVLRAVYELLSPKERRQAAGVLGLMLVTAFFELLGVGSILPFLGMAMDPGIVQRNSGLSWAYTTLGFQSFTDFLVFFGVAILTIFVLMNLVSALSSWAQMRFAYRWGHSISVRLMECYLAKPYAYFLTHNTSELSKNILAESEHLIGGVLKPGGVLISRGIVVATLVVFLLMLEPLITLLTMVVVGGTYVAVYALIRRRLERIGRKSVAANQARYKTNAETFGGVKEIKTLGREAYFLHAYRRASSQYAKYQVTKSMYQELPRYLIQTLAFGGFMAAFVFLIASGRSVSQVVPLMGFFAFAALRLLPGFQEILASLAQFRFYEHLLFKFHSELLQENEARRLTPRKEEDSVALPFHEALGFEAVRFRYPGTSKDVVRDLTLEVPKNSSVAVVGMTGAGKTTLVDILLGLLAPDEGQVTVDGVEIVVDNVSRWRKQVGYVPQDVFLIDDTVAKNIAFGLDEHEIDRGAVQKAAAIAHIHDFITKELPHGYDTVIGERGVRISGGQRQRLGIARALYHDPTLLVLDEATSDIDNITEAYITEAIQGLAGTKTLVIVAHRLATIRRCDRILLLEGGKIVASGTYDELVHTSAKFQRLIQPTPTPVGESR